MSLRRRLLLALAGLVAVTVFLAWAVAGGAILRPLSRSLLQQHLDSAVYVASELHAGHDEVAQALGVEARRLPAAPPGPGDHRRWVEVTHQGHDVMYVRGPRNIIAVETPTGWIAVHHKLDLGSPGRRLPAFFLIVGVLVFVAVGWIGRVALRPLDTTRRAMEQMAGGDLSHRLATDQGPPELREAATAFNAMADRIDAGRRADKELMAGISHELRTPLTRLELELSLLEDTAPERVAAMRGDLGELEKLIRELTTISRLELGDAKLADEPLDLAALAAATGATVQGAAFPLRGDATLFARALDNLVRNARKHAETQPTIRLVGRRIEVVDDGPGVPEDALDRLFEPFFRTDASRARSSGGTGLGLMIVRQVTELHGGSVEALNVPGGGLIVRLDFG
ncbi:MAG: HAMP domain-containing protein [Proteobacteria bacterium]|nr:HAMP domain-containing protein [Pseudomonadota bacterium]MCP4921289.1 HAMP domain-containing protein [Pseudomonadota bacterium]